MTTTAIPVTPRELLVPKSLLEISQVAIQEMNNLIWEFWSTELSSADVPREGLIRCINARVGGEQWNQKDTFVRLIKNYEAVGWKVVEFPDNFTLRSQ